MTNWDLYAKVSDLRDASHDFNELGNTLNRIREKLWNCSDHALDIEPTIEHAFNCGHALYWTAEKIELTEGVLKFLNPKEFWEVMPWMDDTSYKFYTNSEREDTWERHVRDFYDCIKLYGGSILKTVGGIAGIFAEILAVPATGGVSLTALMFSLNSYLSGILEICQEVNTGRPANVNLLNQYLEKIIRATGGCDRDVDGMIFLIDAAGVITTLNPSSLTKVEKISTKLSNLGRYGSCTVYVLNEGISVNDAVNIIGDYSNKFYGNTMSNSTFHDVLTPVPSKIKHNEDWKEFKREADDCGALP